LKVLRKLGSIILLINKFFWSITPPLLRQSRIGMSWGRFIFYLVNLKNDHIQLTTTYFFRNRAELDQLADIACASSKDIGILVVGCSEGAEVFSIVMTAKKACPEIRIKVMAFDIDETALSIARNARYDADSRLFKYVHEDELNSFFIRENNSITVKPELQSGIQWQLGDPTRDPVYSTLPKQDIVFINRLLFHMSLDEAERCLSAAASLVRPGGHLFVSGVDLDLRTKLARNGRWIPVTDRLEAVHAGDESMTIDWPFERWGLEPLDRKHKDWPMRYCAIYKLPE